MNIYQYNIHIVNFFIISGILQIFLIASVLFIKHNNTLANKLLALTLIVLNFQFLWVMVIDVNLDTIFPWTISFPYSYILAVGPLIYFYTKSVTNIHFKLTADLYMHFIPVIFEVICEVTSIVLAKQQDVLIFKTSFFFFYKPVEQVLGTVSIYLYINKSLFLIDQHQNWVLGNLSNTKDITLKWLQTLLFNYRILWLMWIPFVVLVILLFKFNIGNLFIFICLYLFLTAITYFTWWIGMEGLKRSEPILIKEKISDITEEKVTGNKNYSSLSEGEINRYKTILRESMQIQKSYLNENLSLSQLAKITGLNSNLISYILNQHLNKNFFDFVNEYRVEEVKHRLTDPAFQHLNVLGIALETGFNSKASFNRIFKKVTSLSPTEYKSKNNL
jgi:AraC-like DNA-binding protein